MQKKRPRRQMIQSLEPGKFEDDKPILFHDDVGPSLKAIDFISANDLNNVTSKVSRAFASGRYIAEKHLSFGVYFKEGSLKRLHEDLDRVLGVHKPISMGRLIDLRYPGDKIGFGMVTPEKAETATLYLLCMNDEWIVVTMRFGDVRELFRSKERHRVLKWAQERFRWPVNPVNVEARGMIIREYLREIFGVDDNEENKGSTGT